MKHSSKPRRLGLFTLQNCLLAVALILCLSLAAIIHVVAGGGTVTLFSSGFYDIHDGEDPLFKNGETPNFDVLMRKFSSDVSRLITMIPQSDNSKDAAAGGDIPDCVTNELLLLKEFIRASSCDISALKERHEKAAGGSAIEHDFEHHEGDADDTVDGLDEQEKDLLLLLFRKQLLKQGLTSEEEAVLAEVKREQPSVAEQLQRLVQDEGGFAED